MSTVVATNINTDALVGNTSANSITVRGEGSATTVLNQGLCKAWSNNAGGSSISINDSFNVSSITDDGLGDIGNVFTNPMASANYCVSVDGGYQNDDGIAKQSFTTSEWGTYAYNEGSRDAKDATSNQYTVHGDLA